MSFFSLRPTSWTRTALTLLLASAAAQLCVWLGTPIPWMIGPLLATSLMSVLGAPTESWIPLRNAGQWVIGTALGLYFTPAVGALVAGLSWGIALGIAWALALGLGFGAWMRRVHAGHLSGLTPAQLRSTTYFAGSIGVSLGVRFNPAFVHTAPRWLASVAFASGVMMGLCAGFAWLLAALTGLHPATLVLGTAPGGIAEMAITAKVLQLGVPVVTAFQVCRLVAVLVLAEPVYRWLSRNDKA